MLSKFSILSTSEKEIIQFAQPAALKPALIRYRGGHYLCVWAGGSSGRARAWKLCSPATGCGRTGGRGATGTCQGVPWELVPLRWVGQSMGGAGLRCPVTPPCGLETRSHSPQGWLLAVCTSGGNHNPRADLQIAELRPS